MKILILIITLMITTNLYADLLVKKKINFNNCQEIYDTGNYNGEGIYKVRKDDILQDVNCVEELEFKEEHSHYNGNIESKLIVNKIQENCSLKNQSDVLDVSHNRPTCIVKANKILRIKNNDVIELEFDFYRSSYSLSELVNVNFFNILEMSYKKNIESGISIGNINENETNFYNLYLTSKNKIKLIKEKNKYSLYVNENLIDEKSFNFNLTGNDIIISVNNSGSYISNINIKIYKKNIIESI